jgi:hypothetical protein
MLAAGKPFIVHPREVAKSTAAYATDPEIILACTNAIENMQGTIRRVTRNVKRCRDASMALRWAAAGMLEAKAGFRRLKAYRQLPALRQALAEHHSRRLQMNG